MYDLAGETDRLAAVQRYHILDTPPEAVFDRITATAARVFAVPIALLTVVDRDRIWVKSRYGLSLDHLDREPGLCASAIGQRGLYVIPDAQSDPRAQGHSLVRGELGLRFYAAAPLTTADGYGLGALCILDCQPRQVALEQLQTLVDLAAVVMAQLDLCQTNRQLTSHKRTETDLWQLNQFLETQVADRTAQLAQRNAELEASNHALRRSQAMLLESQAVGHIGSWDYDVATQKVTWSAEKFRILGRDPALGEPSFDELLRRYHPDDDDQMRQAVGQALTTGKPYQLRLRCTREDGSIRHLEERGRVERNAEGEVVRLYGIVQDITDWVQAEQDRQEISTALALAVEGISRLDKAGRYTHVNQAYAAMTGYAPNELLGQPWQITMHPDDLKRLTAAYETMLAQGKVTVDARGVRKNGSTFYKQLLMVVARDDRGEGKGHYCFMKDISERVQLEADRRQAEIALQESEERYRLMVSALSEGLAIVQADGTLLTCNDSAARLFGLPSARLLGRSLVDLEGQIVGDDGAVCPVDDLPPLVTLRTGQAQANRVMGIVKSRHITWVSVNTQPLQHPGATQPYAVVVSFADITDLRRSEVVALRRQAEQERLLSDIAQRIRKTLDLNAILNTTVSEVQQFLRTDRVMICRIDEGNQGTIIAEATTVEPSLLGRRVPITPSPDRLADLLHSALIAVADLSIEVESQCPIDRLTQARGKVVVPIVQHSRLWGLLLASHSGPRPWVASELEVLQRLVTQIAIAIQQSQLYQRLQGMNRQLEYLATHDGLTQVANRRSFDTYLQQEWARLGRDQAPLSLILCDIDHFKPYNDTYGHPAGDACLQQVAQVLEQAVKRPADLVARYGGEEFAIVLPSTDAAGAIAIARDIQQTLVEQAIFHGASPLGRRITLSLGLASTLPTPGRSPQTLIDAADAALYSAKNQGRDRYCLAPGDEGEPQT